ncbi:MAG: 3-deoxy-D-manno-octulosonic acid transferase [Pseudomonadota bacterium]
MRPTALYRLYSGVTTAMLPFAARRAVNKLRTGGVDITRAHERLGHATGTRGFGPLIWFHGASVGEAKSVLPLMHMISKDYPEAQLLLTSGTATSAAAIAGKLPAGAQHQFSPLDAAGPVGRFFRHWRPDLCVLVESELWPTLLDRCATAGVPVALLNARLSDKSAQGWRRFPKTARYVLRAVRLAHCQDARSRDHLRAMGLSVAQQGANLKAMLGPVAPPQAQLNAARDGLGSRPVWVAASTHPGEEEAVLAAHKALLANHPALCLILVPRHPERAPEIVQLIGHAGLSHAQRSAGAALDGGAQVYLADTIGETDLWNTLSPIVFVGGTFSDVGGHTPFEPAAADSAILHGPHYANFTEAYAAFQLRDASIQVTGADALAAAVHDLLTHPSRAAQLAANARPLVASGTEALTTLGAQLFSLADAHARDGHA